LYVDVRDIFVETMQDVLPAGIAKISFPLLRLLERKTFERADRINLVSEGFRPYFEARFPGRRYDFFTNGIDDEFLSESWQSPRERRPGPVRVVYAGNIGEGQGLHRIIPGMAKSLGSGYEFCIVGDGGRHAALEKELALEGVNTVSVRKPVPRAELIALYRDADVLFLHLNDHRAFLRVLPSKIFEYAATGKPVLAGVAGHAAQFLKDNVPNCAVFPPCNVEAGVKGLSSLTLGWMDRREFIKTHRRQEIMQGMASSALDLVLFPRAAATST
jgi:glycosyltransferase involved in cell wall biosynthesis